MAREATKKNPANRKVERTQNRPERRPLRKKNVIPSVTIPGFFTCLVSDEGTRISDCLDAGFTFVTVEEAENNGMKVQENYKCSLGDDSLQKTQSEGSIIKVQINRDRDANAKYGILMKQPLEFYKEDFEAAQKDLDESEATWNPQINKDHGPDFYS